jgi:hypothetical protein
MHSVRVMLKHLPTANMVTWLLYYVSDYCSREPVPIQLSLWVQVQLGVVFFAWIIELKPVEYPY